MEVTYDWGRAEEEFTVKNDWQEGDDTFVLEKLQSPLAGSIKIKEDIGVRSTREVGKDQVTL